MAEDQRIEVQKVTNEGEGEPTSSSKKGLKGLLQSAVTKIGMMQALSRSSMLQPGSFVYYLRPSAGSMEDWVCGVVTDCQRGKSTDASEDPPCTLTFKLVETNEVVSATVPWSAVALQQNAGLGGHWNCNCDIRFRSN